MEDTSHINRFSAPIPGSSLTQAPGSAKFEQPPQFSDPGKALEYTFSQMTQPKQSAKILTLVNSGAPLEAMARTLAFEGFRAGKWTPDMALGIVRPIMWQLAGVTQRAINHGWVDEANVKTLLPDKEQIDFMASMQRNKSPEPAAPAPQPSGNLPAPDPTPETDSGPVQFKGLLGGMK
jgi:hypothetical protein